MNKSSLGHQQTLKRVLGQKKTKVQLCSIFFGCHRVQKKRLTLAQSESKVSSIEYNEANRASNADGELIAQIRLNRSQIESCQHINT